MKNGIYALLPLAAAGLYLALPAQQTTPAFNTTKVEIAARDGVKLHTEIHVPSNATAPLPFLITRTPYRAADLSSALVHGERFRELARDGYIFVFQDIRGRYDSGGQFVMMRPPRDPSLGETVDEGTDAYDTIDWLVKNIPNNNGRAGMFGISYPGWLTEMAALEPHPALKAVSEQAAPADMYLGDDFHHNGALRLSYGFEYSSSMETSKVAFSFKFDRFDLFEWYLSLVPLSSANTFYFHNSLPTWNAFIEHPDYDAYWQRLAVPRYIRNVTVPNLNVAGWWDQEDFYGPLKIYETSERLDSKALNYLVVGPWNHGGWSRSGSRLGQIEFGSDTAEYFRQDIEAPWFAHWLKDRGDGHFPEARIFQTGTNHWETYSQWPPEQDIERRKLYFQPDSRLSFDPPEETGPNACDTFDSDPARPVPYRRRPIGPTYGRPGWSTWLLEDQRFVDLRPDVLSWTGEPLRQDLIVSGDIVAQLFASTTGSDADWIVKLIDVYPEGQGQLGGYQLMIASEVFRGRYRNSFEHPEPITPGRVTPFRIDLHTNDHAFLKGHRIMVQVQSTWFPLIDRNPQNFVPNIYQASAEDYRKATHRVYRSRLSSSHLELPVKVR